MVAHENCQERDDNKQGVNYIFNTSKQNRKISKILSGLDAKAKVSLKAFASQKRTKIEAAERLQFLARQDLGATRHNIN